MRSRWQCVCAPMRPALFAIEEDAAPIANDEGVLHPPRLVRDAPQLGGARERHADAEAAHPTLHRLADIHLEVPPRALPRQRRAAEQHGLPAAARPRRRVAVLRERDVDSAGLPAEGRDQRGVGHGGQPLRQHRLRCERRETRGNGGDGGAGRGAPQLEQLGEEALALRLPLQGLTVPLLPRLQQLLPQALRLPSGLVLPGQRGLEVRAQFLRALAAAVGLAKLRDGTQL
mmetsp:Transcript_69408/g.214488  ORF Transcript_69408/g.214488 Transcript_69408/m.214488 type:complete len:230 (-) Transcript_69408:642-1331(-)